ncbi:MAG: TusE/DsrC/DsvC family sulfur relay protein [Candidatus Thiodiazotropha endolucinida]
MSTNPYATRIEYLDVDGNRIATDQEGYNALAKKERLEITQDHWDVIRYIREYYQMHRVQAQVRDMIKHFKLVWGPSRGNNRYLHDIFPRGGPQKQGNRLAGIRRTKGEH